MPLRTVIAAGALLVAASDAAAAPPPDAPLPRDPARLAAALTRTTTALDRAIDRWRRVGDPSRGGPPETVTLQALYQQRILLTLTARPTLARAVLRRLRGPVRSFALETVVAKRKLWRLSAPRPLSAFRIGPAAPAGVLLRHYREGQRRFGVAWQVLAAVNLVESAFGRVRNTSTAGAQGPMQFLPSTWRAYGLGGDVRDPRDAILGAANYLRASGAPRDYRRALYAYNRSWLYVDAVLRYARRMSRDSRAFFAYYSWQVFVRTPAGLRRLTGPRR